jgi:uncharacterized protein (DUF924 family)
MVIRTLILSTLCMLSCVCCFAEQQPDPRINEILTYWFGDLHSPEDYPQKQSTIWFNGGADIDREIRNRFEYLVWDAANHKLDKWKQTPRGRLALILLVDQFSRNMFRGSPNAFAFDALAQSLTLEGLNLKEDQALFPIERAFFYLPLEHSESLKLQEVSVAKFNELAASVVPSLTSIFKSFADYAWSHYLIIEKFGRFPHRNAIIGRESSSEESKFLEGPNSSF